MEPSSTKLDQDGDGGALMGGVHLTEYHRPSQDDGQLGSDLTDHDPLPVDDGH